MPSSDILFKSQAFFKVNVRGASPFNVADAYVFLKELSEYLKLVDNSGERWVVLPHQLLPLFCYDIFSLRRIGEFLAGAFLVYGA